MRRLKALRMMNEKKMSYVRLLSFSKQMRSIGNFGVSFFRSAFPLADDAVSVYVAESTPN